MALSPGTRLGPYEVGEVLGAGGMGEVYRARDIRLDRSVAIKILPPEFASDTHFEERFEREARSVAALNHPHICTLHDVGQQDGTHFLVMELVEGDTLAERLQQGPIAVGDALALARQIAEALEAAHEKGILHRDLKPANIKVTPNGSVKVLDFGLAKVLDPADGARVSNSPTLSRLATQAGLVMGTAAYMSPEQARGKPVDRRTDVWAYGCVLYEMLTAKPAFGGETVTDILGAIVHKEPDWSALPADATPRLRELLLRCLHKDQKQRLRDMGDVQWEIDAARIAPPPIDALRVNDPIEARGRRSHRRPWIAWATALALGIAAAVAGVGWWRLATERPPIVRLHVQLSPEGSFQPQWGQAAVLSPDGSLIAYVAGPSTTERQIYIRRLDELEGKALSGTIGGSTPFFSPDGQWIGFFSSGALRRVPISGGAPITVAQMGEGRGGVWGPDDTIVFTPTSASALFRVPATGGTPEPLTTRDEKTERSHRWPQFLPGGRAVLFTAGFLNRRWDESNIEVIDLSTRQRRVVYRGGTFARYLPTGHLTFVRESTLFAIPFDLGALEVTGTPVPVLNGIRGQFSNEGSGVGLVEVSSNGTLAYVPSDSASDSNRSRLSLVDRAGVVTPATTEQADFLYPRVSPDGTRVALSRSNAGSSISHIWVYDLARGGGRRLTLDEGVNDLAPIWTRDGKRITYTASTSLFWIPADGSAAGVRLTQSDFLQRAGSWSPDGNTLIFEEQAAQTSWDILTLSLDGDQKPRVFLRTNASEAFPEFSPDGRWVAYQSNESGYIQVYVRAFPDSGAKWNISTGFGRYPRWSADGTELVYSSNDAIMSVAVKAGATGAFQYEPPRELMKDTSARRIAIHTWDVMPDGRRFVMVQGDSQADLTPPTHVTLVFNWFEDLKARLGQR